MAELHYVTALPGGPDSVTSLEIRETAGGPVLMGYAANGTLQGAWDLGGGVMTPTGAPGTASPYAAAGLSLNLSQGTHGLSGGQFARIAATGSLTVALDGSAFGKMRVEALWHDRGDSAGWLFVEDPTGGILRFDITGSALQSSGILSLTPAAVTAAGPVDDMLYLDTGTGGYMVTVSAASDAVTLWRVAASGALTAVGQAPPGLGIDAPSAVCAATVQGHDYLVVAAAGSSSLSVFRIAPDGGLDLTDHVLDDSATTRFGNVQVLETVEHDGRVYLFAAGSDQGISVLTLLPGGQLVHLASLADDTALTLDAVSAITATVTGAGIQVFATSGSEPGVTQLAFDPGPVGSVKTGGSASDTLTGGAENDILTGNGGDDVLTGGPGSDILIDGSGSDTLTGGPGEDLFILTADGTRDTILDYNPARDRLDLSGFHMFYHVGQLQIVPDAQGATLIFGDEEIRIRSAGFMPLDASDFSNATVAGLHRPPSGSFVSRTRIEGTGKADRLIGTEANLQLVGKSGDDILTSFSGDNILDGGSGQDCADYSAAGQGVNVDIEAGLAVLGPDWRDILIEIEHVVGTAYDDTITGNGADNRISGGGGSDTFVLGVDRSAAAVSRTAGGHLVVSALGEDTLTGVEFIRFDDQVLDLSSLSDPPPPSPPSSPPPPSPSAPPSPSPPPPPGPTPGNDDLAGTAGDDDVNLLAGDDSYSGLEGDDRVFGAAGADTLDGGEGADTLVGDGGNDVLQGGDGADVLYGFDDADRLDGGAGDDELYPGNGPDWAYGDEGDDLIVDNGQTGVLGSDHFFGGAGNDTVLGAGGNETILGGDGDDALFGAHDDDLIYGGNNADYVGGGIGHDTLFGGNGADSVYGGDGDDLIYDNDQAGAIGADRFFGNHGDDTILGGGGADMLHGGFGRDSLMGGVGDDTLFGYSGNDTLKGGVGDDMLFGEGGSDVFVFTDGHGEDTIFGFNASDDNERIDLRGVAAITSYDDLQANHISRVGPNVVIDTGTGEIILINTSFSNLDAADFIF